VSVLSAGCILWLERLRPLFVSVAVLTLAYQGWLIVRRPPQRRSWKVLGIFWTSLVLTVMMFAAWGVLSLRYR
jgi:hypothetical protein